MAIVGIVRGGEREAVKCLCLCSVTTGPQLPEHFTLLQNWRRPLYLELVLGTRGDGDRDEVQLAVIFRQLLFGASSNGVMTI